MEQLPHDPNASALPIPAQTEMPSQSAHDVTRQPQPAQSLGMQAKRDAAPQAQPASAPASGLPAQSDADASAKRPQSEQEAEFVASMTAGDEALAQRPAASLEELMQRAGSVQVSAAPIATRPHERDAAKRQSKMVADAPDISGVWRSGQDTAQPQQRNLWHDPLIAMGYVKIPGGCYPMGDINGQANELPVHEVCVDDFWMARHEVTRKQWTRVMGKARASDSVIQNRQQRENDEQGDHPVTQVSWHDVQTFIDRLNNSGAGHFRLPTEAEWEYACREGGRKQTFCGGEDLDSLAWHSGNSGRESHPVATRAANAFGLFDMTGNAWEWVNDWYAKDAYRVSARRNPTGPGTGREKVFRGGGYLSNERYLRAGVRYYFPPDRRFNLLGFRLVRMAEPFTGQSKYSR
ncbi:formylglycine-generating enzyme family protein [Magnetofaba australis]|uniref:formylglycine-generating enzyme family protein n=1 Tax=Magnetofaba australis TaxID=1472297 RepID=UPI00117CB52F|nr:SUMF1/EgtB/PvdO family nonheme iron enzyme [Magnetofaba australis]